MTDRQPHDAFLGAVGALEESGDLTVEIHLQSNRPAKKVYRITDKGRCSLSAWLNMPLGMASPQFGDEVSAKLMLVGSADIDAIASIVRQHRRACLERLTLASRKQRVLKTTADERIAKVIVDGAETRIRAELAWLERIERSVVKEWA